tara:strand:- start:127 stop:423 length:297 start_codon:yes stop_codon:yes gene_type:complete
MILLIILCIIFAAMAGYMGYRAYILAGLLADIEDYYINVEKTNVYMYNQIQKSYETMKQIDTIGAFENEDEAGTTFQMLKQVIDELKGEFDGPEKEEK